MNTSSKRRKILASAGAALMLTAVLASCGDNDQGLTTGEQPTVEPLADPNQDVDVDDNTSDEPPVVVDESPTESPAEAPTEEPIPVDGEDGIGDGAGPIPEDAAAEERIPVEPDGGIGNGAGPLPGADEDPVDNTWHGPQVPETNCFDTEFQRIEASAFSFSVPAFMEIQDVEGIDSEIGELSGAGVQVSYDYGWYSNPMELEPGILEEAELDYSGIVGRKLVFSDASAWGTEAVGVHFPAVDGQGEEVNKLSLVITFENPDDRLFAECIAGSISWNEAQ